MTDAAPAMRRPLPGVNVTVTDVAQEAGVSRATAARALGDYGSVSPDARERVKLAAERLHYRPNLIARTTRTGIRTTIGLVVADIANPYFGQVSRGVADVAGGAGYEVMLVSTDENLQTERAGVQLLIRQRVAGIIVSPASRTEASHLRDAQKSGTPVVLLDRRIADFDADRVYTTNLDGARELMADLIARGHRRIAFLSSAERPAGYRTGRPLDVTALVTSAGDRAQAYVDALTAVDINPFRYFRLCEFGEQAAYEATRRLLGGRGGHPTAIFASDSIIALGALRAIVDQGLSIPDDVVVVAGDEPTWARVVTPALSAIRQPTHLLGSSAMELLRQRLATPEAPFSEVVLPAGYVRHSPTALITDRAGRAN